MPPRPPTPTPEMRKIERDLNKLALMHLDPANARVKDTVAARLNDKREELKTLRAEQLKAYEADIAERRDVDSKQTAAAVKRFHDISTQAAKDQSAKYGLDQAAAILDDGLSTGQLSNTMEWGTRAADTFGRFLEYLPFGIDANKISAIKSARKTAGAMETLHGVSAKALHDVLGGFGAGIAIPEGDRLAKMISSNDKTVLGNRNLIKFANEFITTRMQASREIGEYMRKMQNVPGGPREADMDEIMARHVDQALTRMEAETKATRGGKLQEAAEAAKTDADQVAANEATKAAAVAKIKEVGRAVGSRVEDFFGGRGAGPPRSLSDIPAPAVEDPSYPGVPGPAPAAPAAAPTGGWASRRQERNSGAQPQRFAGEDLDYSGLDYGGFKEGRGPLGMESSEGNRGSGSETGSWGYSRRGDEALDQCRVPPRGDPGTKGRPEPRLEEQGGLRGMATARNGGLATACGYPSAQRPSRDGPAGWARRPRHAAPSDAGKKP